MSFSRNKRAWKRRLFQAQEGICPHCQLPMIHPDEAQAERWADEWPDHHPEHPSLDRVMPGAYGGKYTISNVLLAHKECNEKRGDGRLHGFARAMHKRIQPILAKQLELQDLKNWSKDLEPEVK